MSKQWCVYFIKDSTSKNSPTKIGYTCDIVKRLSTIQTYNPRELKLDCTIPCDSKAQAQKLERFLHRQLYHRCHIRGEWFNLHNIYIPPLLNKFYGSHKQMFPDSEPLVLHKRGDLDYKVVLKENIELKQKVSYLESELKVNTSISVSTLQSEIDNLNTHIQELRDTISLIYLR